MEAPIDLDSIIGNHMNEGLYEEEEKKHKIEEGDSMDGGKGRRNAIVGFAPVENDLTLPTFMTGFEESNSVEDTEQRVLDNATAAHVIGTWNPKYAASTIPTTLNEHSSLKFKNVSELDVNSQILLQNVSYDNIVKGKLRNQHLVPGGLAMSKEETNKYFGVEAKHNFYHQLQSMQRKRHIYGTDPTLSSPAELSHAIALASPGSMMDQMTEGIPFQIDRPEKVLKVNTRVIIRTQGIGVGEAYEQMKLIQKPKHLNIEDQCDSNSVDSDDYNNKPTSEITFSKPPTLSIDIPSPKKSMATPNGVGNLKSPKMQRMKPSPSNIKLKPLSTVKPHTSPGLILAHSNGGSGPNSARSSDSGRSGKKMLSPMQREDDTESRTPKHGKLKVSSKSVSAKSKQGNLRMIKEESENKGSPSIAVLADLYKDHLLFTKSQDESKRATREKGDSDETNNLDGVEFVCIDHRDTLNRKILDNLHKKSSLFKYVEAKAAKKDFYDLSDNSDQSDCETEIRLWDTQSPLSPAHVVPTSGPPSKISRKTKKGKSMNLMVDESFAPSDHIGLSPRSKFIDSCIRKKLNPRASLILRKTFTKELNLKHLGMGDEMAVLLADAIVSIPYIQSLNICDNNLADRGLSAIIDAVCHMTDLVELNMSMNEIGPNAAFALNNYLSKDNCPLITLILRKADVDDDECRDFVQALEHNKNLKTLDLSENLVGSSENLNSVMPDLITGGEALADLLSSPQCPLSSLRLGWNMIRLDGAAALCGALAINQSLTFLELSFNSLGASGGVALGDALQDNKALKTLLLANNSLDSIACLTICAGILENEALREVSFDGNPIGEQGAKALMLLPTIVGSRVAISAKTCNITMRDPKNWFDTTSLVRKFELELSEPFERAISILLLYLIPSHQTYIAPSSEYFDPTNKQWIDLKLKENIDKDYFSKRPLDLEQQQLINRLKRVLAATRDIAKAKELFEEMDEDGSGELDEHEFGKLMESIGMDASESKVQEVLAEYDVDGGGVIEMAEFLLFLKNQRKEAKKRLQELTEFPILVSEHFNSAIRYIPPKVGIFRITIIDGFTQKETFRVISPGDRVNILKVAEQSGELLQMTSFGMKNYKVRLDEALVLAHQLLKETNNKVKVLATLLPQMSTSADARLLVSKLLGQNLLELSRLKREIGQSYRVLMGQPDGFYALDMSNEMDRFCINRLLEISMTTQHFRSSKRSCLGYGKLGDTSQKGNFSCFRNELLNKKPTTITVEFASPLPRSGKLEFDFVSQKRYKSDNFVLNDIRFTNLLVKLFMLNPYERPKVITHLRVTRKHCDRSLGGDGKTVHEFTKDQSFEIGNAMACFYNKLSERVEQYDKYRAKESVKCTWDFDANILQLSTKTAKFVYEVPFLYKSSLDKFPKPGSERRNFKEVQTRPNVDLSPFKGSPQTEALTSTDQICETLDADKVCDNTGEESFNKVSEKEPEQIDGGNSAEAPNDILVANMNRKDTSKFEDISSFEQAEEEIGEVVNEGDENEDEERDGDFALADRPLIETRSSKIMSKADNNSNGARMSERQATTAMKAGRSSFLSAFTDKSKIDKKDQSGSQDLHNSTQEILRLIQDEEARELEADPDEYTATREPKKLTEVLNKFICMMGSKNVPVYAKAAKMLELLIEQFETQFMYARHLELLVLLFQDYGVLKNSDDFGTYRVDLVVHLFSCIVDIHNLEIVFRQMTSFEIACVRCRLGFLNVFNPMKPEGSYEFDLSRREERQIVKMLAQLSVVEPGDNLPFVQFRWERDMDPMPGYELTEPWLTEDGMPNKGLWNVTYYSGEGKGKKGCKPVVKLRKSMLQLVLIEEEEIISESERDQEHNIVPVGSAYIKSNPTIWWSYLAYDENEYKAIKEKKGTSAGGAADKKKK